MQEQEQETKFSETFLATLNDLEKRAQAAGLTITAVCREAGVSRATPDRWRMQVPNTISLLDKMQAIVVKAETSKQ